MNQPNRLRTTPNAWEKLVNDAKLTSDTREWLASCAGVNESVVVLTIDPSHPLAIKTAAQIAQMSFSGRTAGAIERIRQALCPQETVTVLTTTDENGDETAAETAAEETKGPEAPQPVVAVSAVSMAAEQDRNTEIAAFMSASARVSIREQFRDFATGLLAEEKGK